VRDRARRRDAPQRSIACHGRSTPIGQQLELTVVVNGFDGAGHCEKPHSYSASLQLARAVSNALREESEVR